VQLSKQLGYPAIDLSRSVVKIPLLATIPYEIAVKVLALPVAFESDRLLVALAEPHRRETVDEIAFRSGKRVIPHVALEIALRETIERCYTFARAGAQDLYLGEEADLSHEIENGHAAVVTSHDVPQVSSALRAATVQGLSRSEAASAERAAVVPSGTKRILIVDDDPELQKLCERLLRPLKADITLAGTGSQALEAIRRTEPDLILLDAMLPEVHGFEICRQVKTSTRFQAIPIIMMSAVYRGWRFHEDILNVYRADAFVEKPFDINHLYRLAEDFLARSTGRSTGRSMASDPAVLQIAVEETEALFAAGKLDEAEGRLNEALLEQPFVAPLRLLLGRVKIARGMPYEAMNEFERAVELAPNLFVALKELAILYEERGFRRKASEIWERAKASCPDPSLVPEIDQHLRNIT
jgi:DNA-binding response OmpR family regulator